MYSHECYDREKLYNEVWEEPVLKVAKRYGISDVAIAKICKKMRIPVPGRGYWAKLKSGKKLKKASLPKFKDCPKVQISRRTKEKKEEKTIERMVPKAFEILEVLTTKELSPEMKIIYDPEVRITNQYIKTTKKKLQENLKSYSKVYNYGRINSNNDESFAVSIGPDNCKRALAILQTLYTALKIRGFKIGLNPKDIKSTPQYSPYYQQYEPTPIYAIVLDEYISFRITEVSKKTEIEEKKRKNTYEQYEYIPTGKLKFEILHYEYESFVRSTWNDGKRQRIEDYLNDIIINMIKAATINLENTAIRKKREEDWKIEEAIQQKKLQLEKINNQRIGNLLEDTKRDISYKQIKEYVKIVTVEGKRRLGEEYQESDFQDWVQWAHLYLGKINPINGELPRYKL